MLLAFAGGVVIIAAFTGMMLWGTIVSKLGVHARSFGVYIYLLLGMVLVALVLAIAGIARFPGQCRTSTSTRNELSQYWPILAVLVLIHCVTAFFLSKPGSADNIDTYTFQRDACRNLLHGTNPFGTTQADIFSPSLTALYYGPNMVLNGRVQIGFQYPPLTLFWALPGYLLGDVRYSYLIAIIISAFLLFAIAPDKHGLGLVSVLLLSPLTFAVENRCWTEPMVLMTLSATVYAAGKKRWWLPIALGLFLASKQYNILALPLIGYFIRPFSWKAYWKLSCQGLGVAAVTILPFAFWNVRGLWHDLILFHLAQPFRLDAVSFAVIFPALEKIGPILVVVFLAWALKAQRRDPAIFPSAYGVAVLLFFATSKQAFANYYFLIAQAFFLSVAALHVFQNDQPEMRNRVESGISADLTWNAPVQSIRSGSRG